VFAVKFVSKVELFAEDHPFVQVHFISFQKVLTKKTLGIISSFAKTLEC